MLSVVHRIVVDYHDVPIGGEVNVKLQDAGTDSEALPEPYEGVFGSNARASPVRNVHGPILRWASLFVELVTP